MQLLKQCLKNVPSQRPSADDVLTMLQDVRAERVEEFNISLITLDMARVKIIQDRQVQEKKVEQLMQQNVIHKLHSIITYTSS